ncbi:hypothetical protein FRC10_011339 [Ceratobasidium sp. 414]|nr:hypothetical protein FRC10_011339 [Ceratobasidium sp. 414]
MVITPFSSTLPLAGGSAAPGLAVDLRPEQNHDDVSVACCNAKSPKRSASDDVLPAVQARARTLEDIHSMIDKYNSGWNTTKRPLKARISPQKERVVVTGTTGALGSYLLAQLLESETVEKVWALNRGSKGMEERQRASFEDKGLDIGLLKSEKLVLTQANLEDGKLGLEVELFEEIRSTATSVIHNAWHINFRLPLERFEPSVKGVRNLLDLAFSSTAATGLPRFLFTSSIAAAGYGKPGRHLKETYLELGDAATALGYGQSKFVAEKLLESARDAGLETCVVRLGQLSGDAVSGSWSITNWLPFVLVSSVSVGCMPVAIGDVSWLPLTVAARSILDIATFCGGFMPPVVQLSHPYPVKWACVFAMFAEALKTWSGGNQILPIVPFNEWNEHVKRAALTFEGSQRDRYRHFPSMRVQSMMEAIARADEELRSRGVEVGIEAGGPPCLDTTEAVRVSETLRNISQISQEHVEKWVGYWVKMGVFHQNKAKIVHSRL